MSEQKPILIIGAGPGGLTLAQVLRKHGIPFRIFDRDAHSEARNQGWAISLHWVIPDLDRELPDDLPPIRSISHLYNCQLSCEGAIYQGGTGKEVSRFSSPGDRSFIRASRSKLRLWLSTNINIEWDKKLESFTENDTGVSARFADGSAVEGNMLVGADGVHSRVRQLLLGPEAAETNLFPMECYGGAATLTKSQYEDQFQNFARSLYVVESSELQLFVGLKEVSPDMDTADYYWMCLRQLTEAEKQDQNGSTKEKGNKEILNAALNCVSVIDQRFTAVVRSTRPEGMYRDLVLMEDFLPPAEGFKGNRVTLLGDAAHKMTPFTGEAGNHAIKDSMDLIAVLDTKHVSTSIRSYEMRMLERTREAVKKSRTAAMDWKKPSGRTDWIKSE